MAVYQFLEREPLDQPQQLPAPYTWLFNDLKRSISNSLIIHEENTKDINTET